jgi:AcrR family transcriptional regulator
MSTQRKDRKDAILDVVLDMVVERGFQKIPMSLVSKRAGASPGVIYHHFPSKEDMIHALYARIKSAKRQVFLEGYSVDVPIQEAFVKMWINAYHFYRSRRRESQFLDMYEHSSFSKLRPLEEPSEQEDIRSHAQKAFRPKKSGGVLKDLSPAAIDEMSWGLALRLAKREEAINPAMLKKIAEVVWTAIAAE